MVIRPKKEIQEFIEKGGDVKPLDDEKIEWSTMCLRLPSPLTKGIDEALKTRYSITKTAWILEAIQEKLDRLKEKEK